MKSVKINGVRLGVLVILLVQLVTTAGCEKGTDSETVAEVPRNVRVLTLDQETVAEFFEISGPVAPVRGTDISSQESGPVVALPVEKGQPVGKGKMVIELDRTLLKAEMEAAKSALALEAYNLDKVRQLHEAGKVSRIELLTAETSHAQAKAQAEILEERHGRAGIRAPFAGVLVDRYVELGELVVPGQRVARLLDPYTLKLEAYLTDAQVQWVTVGEKATVKLGQNWETASGAVSWIGFEADRMTGKFKVEIEIPNPDLKYHSGVIGRARLDKNQVTGVVAIPRGAVLPGRAGPTAFVVEGDRAVLRRLELGAYQGLMVVVTEGLQSGDQLVVRGHRDLRDGNLVQVTETATAADGSLPADPQVITGTGAGSRIQGDGGDLDSSLGDSNVEASR